MKEKFNKNLINFTYLYDKPIQSILINNNRTVKETSVKLKNTKIEPIQVENKKVTKENKKSLSQRLNIIKENAKDFRHIIRKIERTDIIKKKREVESIPIKEQDLFITTKFNKNPFGKIDKFFFDLEAIKKDHETFDRNIGKNRLKYNLKKSVENIKSKVKTGSLQNKNNMDYLEELETDKLFDSLYTSYLPTSAETRQPFYKHEIEKKDFDSSFNSIRQTLNTYSGNHNFYTDTSENIPLSKESKISLNKETLNILLMINKTKNKLKSKKNLFNNSSTTTKEQNLINRNNIKIISNDPSDSYKRIIPIATLTNLKLKILESKDNIKLSFLNNSIKKPKHIPFVQTQFSDKTLNFAESRLKTKNDFDMEYCVEYKKIVRRMEIEKNKMIENSVFTESEMNRIIESKKYNEVEKLKKKYLLKKPLFTLKDIKNKPDAFFYKSRKITKAFECYEQYKTKI